ncbi:hypothetical protein NDU88_003249 [Pleurodeles waltl]|uniref:Uncharacterized protein n=1 Tax=Pleurodeles waltl TaxID=8319 RepID=A0AAV7WSK3_PLEWA|nr:hypothetical protein NDU88_003249 [Pleurodeles waltl]
MRTLQLKPALRTTTTKVFAFGLSALLLLAGVFRNDVMHVAQTVSTNICVTKSGSGMLLSFRMAEKLALVSFAFSVHHESIEGLVAEHSQLLNGIGCLKDKLIHLHIDQSILLVALKHCWVAFHLRPKVGKELRKLEMACIIERVEGPIPWVLMIVVTWKPKQPGEVRICVDMRLPNVAIRCERHLTSTIDDIVSEVSGSRWYSPCTGVWGHMLASLAFFRLVLLFTHPFLVITTLFLALLGLILFL